MSDHEVVLSHPDQVEVRPPLMSPTAMESQRITVLESHFQDMLQRLWACNREGHGLCYHRRGHEHVSITKDAFDSWVQQLRPQGFLDSSGMGQGMSNIEREAMTRWFAPVIRNPTDVEVGPGYFCGLTMERIGTKLLYGTKLSILVVKCFFNTWHVQEHQRRVFGLTDTGKGAKTRNRLLEKQLTVGQLSIIVKEGVDLLRHVRFWLGTSEKVNIGRVIVVMAHVIDLMNPTAARVTQPATRVTQHGQVFLRVAFDKLQPLLIVDKVPEALSFAHCVLSKPTQGLEKETKKEMQQMQQDKRLPQLSMDVDNQKLSRSSRPLKGIIGLVNRILHPVLKRQSNQSQGEGGRA
ncbi:hypothetical protein BU17DRAFT_70866 [Hysterangium stoloniferum]|nr:hypothetical protein BU17DRAFT_70866 [Hysterangium stoloniferum]